MCKNIKQSAIAIHMPLIDHFLGKHWFFDLVLLIYWRDLKGINPKIVATKFQNIEKSLTWDLPFNKVQDSKGISTSFTCALRPLRLIRDTITAPAAATAQCKGRGAPRDAARGAAHTGRPWAALEAAGKATSIMAWKASAAWIYDGFMMDFDDLLDIAHGFW